MASDLAATPRSGLITQICGDAHLSNFGAFASPERRLVFDVNDFDETLPGPWEWDLKRLGASLVVAGRDNGHTDEERASVVMTMVRWYRETMRKFSSDTNLEVWYAHLAVDEVIGRIREQIDPEAVRRFERTAEKAHTHDAHQAMSKLTVEVDGEPRFANRPPLLVPVEELLPDSDQDQLHDALIRVLATYRRTLPADRRALLGQYRAVHLARKVVGVGSVGLRAYVALLLGRDGEDPLFLQLKEAEASVLEGHLAPERIREPRPTRGGGPAHDARRQRHLPGVGAHQGSAGRQGPGLLRPPAPRLEDVDPARDPDPRGHGDLWGHLRVDARTSPRALGRSHRDLRLHGHGPELRSRDHGVLGVLRRPERTRLRVAPRGREGWSDPALDAGLSAPRWREVFRGQRGRLTGGLLLLEALVAIQVLVVATILPDIRRDLGMVQLYGLVFTASSLATLAAIPIVGGRLDRFGARTTLTPVLFCFTAGLIVSALAPSMPVVLVGQFLQGAGGGGLYALSLGTIAKTYPDRLRPRVMALLASMWILPGLIGPPVGAVIASTVGWRYAFLAPIPVLIIGWLLITPALDLVPDPEPQEDELSNRWPLQLMVGAGLLFTSFTIIEPWTIVLSIAGLVIGIPALRRIVPPGTFRARPGTPASAASAFLLSAGFLAMDAFLTLMLTVIRDLSLAIAGLAITGASITWALGSAWQSGRADRWPLSRLLSIGTGFTLLGQVMVASALWITGAAGRRVRRLGVRGPGHGDRVPDDPARGDARCHARTRVGGTVLGPAHGRAGRRGRSRPRRRCGRGGRGRRCAVGGGHRGVVRDRLHRAGDACWWWAVASRVTSTTHGVECGAMTPVTEGGACRPRGERRCSSRLCAGQFLMALDSSVMNVSIATVADDLNTTVTGIQTAIVLYTLVMAMLMVTGGKIGSMIGRKRAFTIGLVIYCTGSLTTALAPNLSVLLFGWSLLEGIGAALIMPAIVALVAGNFPPEGRPRAYGIVGAASAIAIAVGPLIGGLATTYASWRWVFAGEVIIGIGIFLFSRRMIDERVEDPGHLDLIGSVLWALGMGLAIFGVLRSGEWGWVIANEGAPTVFGRLSPVIWMILGGLVSIWLFMRHVRRLEGAGREPLVKPTLFSNKQMTGGLVMFFFQYVVMMGLFFVVPLYLSVALGLSAIDTGLKIAPLSISMLLAAAGIPKFFPTVSPRRVAELSLVAAIVGHRAALQRDGRQRERGHRDGPAPVDRARDGWARLATGERHRVGGARRRQPCGGWAPEHRDPVRRVARHRARRLGLDRVLDRLVPDRDRRQPGRPGRGHLEGDGRTVRRYALHLRCRARRRRWRNAGATPQVTQAVLDVNEQARLDGLRSALALLAIIGVIALFFTKGIPQVQPGSDPTERGLNGQRPVAATP